MTRTIRRIAIGSAVAALSAAMLAPTASTYWAD